MKGRFSGSSMHPRNITKGIILMDRSRRFENNAHREMFKRCAKACGTTLAFVCAVFDPSLRKTHNPSDHILLVRAIVAWMKKERRRQKIYASARRTGGKIKGIE